MATYYVDGASGNDTTGDGSQSLPWATIQHALNTIADSTDSTVTLRVKPNLLYAEEGTNDALYFGSGLDGKDITIEPDGDGWIFLDGKQTITSASAVTHGGRTYICREAHSSREPEVYLYWGGTWLRVPETATAWALGETYVPQADNAATECSYVTRSGRSYIYVGAASSVASTINDPATDLAATWWYDITDISPSAWDSGTAYVAYSLASSHAIEINGTTGMNLTLESVLISARPTLDVRGTRDLIAVSGVTGLNLTLSGCRLTNASTADTLAGVIHLGADCTGVAIAVTESSRLQALHRVLAVSRDGGEPGWSLSGSGSQFICSTPTTSSLEYAVLPIKGNMTRLELVNCYVGGPDDGQAGLGITAGSGTECGAAHQFELVSIVNSTVRANTCFRADRNIATLVLSNNTMVKTATGAVRSRIIGIGLETSSSAVTTADKPFESVLIAGNTLHHHTTTDQQHPVFIGIGASLGHGRCRFINNRLISLKNNTYGVVIKSDYVTVAYNEIYSDRALYLAGASRCRVYHNTVYSDDVAGFAFRMGWHQGQILAVENEVRDNIFISVSTATAASVLVAPAFEVSGTNWVEAEKKLTVPSANYFADYRHNAYLPRYITITGGTGVTPGVYQVSTDRGAVSLTDANPSFLVLTESIADTPGDLSNADITGTVAALANEGHAIYNNVIYNYGAGNELFYGDTNYAGEAAWLAFWRARSSNSGEDNIFADPLLSNVEWNENALSMLDSLNFRPTTSSPCRTAASDGGTIGAVPVGGGGRKQIEY